MSFWPQASVAEEHCYAECPQLLRVVDVEGRTVRSRFSVPLHGKGTHCRLGFDSGELHLVDEAATPTRRSGHRNLKLPPLQVFGPLTPAKPKHSSGKFRPKV